MKMTIVIIFATFFVMAFVQPSNVFGQKRINMANGQTMQISVQEHNGVVLVCFKKDPPRKLNIYEVEERYFKGKDILLVKCLDGKISILSN